MRHRRSVRRYWSEALFAKVSNAKRLLAPDPVMLPDKTEQRAVHWILQSILVADGQSRPVQQVSDPDPHVVKQAVREARGNGESERSMD